MCEAQDTACLGCPMSEYPLCFVNIEDEQIDIVEKWCNKHPKMRLPTWLEWQKQKFPMAKEELCPEHVYSFDCPHMHMTCHQCTNQQMSQEAFDALGGEMVVDE